MSEFLTDADLAEIEDYRAFHGLVSSADNPPLAKRIQIQRQIAEYARQKEAAELQAYDEREPNMTEIQTVPYRDCFRHGFTPGSFS